MILSLRNSSTSLCINLGSHSGRDGSGRRTGIRRVRRRVESPWGRQLGRLYQLTSRLGPPESQRRAPFQRVTSYARSAAYARSTLLNHAIRPEQQ